MPIRPGYGGTIGGLENSPAMSGAVGDRKSRPKRAAFQIDSRRGAVIEEEQNEQVRTSKKAGASVISLAPTVSKGTTFHKQETQHEVFVPAVFLLEYLYFVSLCLENAHP